MPCTPAKTSPTCAAVRPWDSLTASGSLCRNSSRRGSPVNLVIWPIPKRRENSVELSAKSAPFSNCKYPTGVSVAGVDTVGRPGLASGTDVAADCARLTCARTLNMKSKQIWMGFNLAPQNQKPQTYLRNKCGTYERA